MEKVVNAWPEGLCKGCVGCLDEAAHSGVLGLQRKHDWPGGNMLMAGIQRTAFTHGTCNGQCSPHTELLNGEP